MFQSFFQAKLKLEETRSSVLTLLLFFFSADVSAIHRNAENALFLLQAYNRIKLALFQSPPITRTDPPEASERGREKNHVGLLIWIFICLFFFTIHARILLLLPAPHQFTIWILRLPIRIRHHHLFFPIRIIRILHFHFHFHFLLFFSSFLLVPLPFRF
jgi:hypothetical protein